MKKSGAICGRMRRLIALKGQYLAVLFHLNTTNGKSTCFITPNLLRSLPERLLTTRCFDKLKMSWNRGFEPMHRCY